MQKGGTRLSADLMTDTHPAMARRGQGPAAVVPASDTVLDTRHVTMLCRRDAITKDEVAASV